jgi:hypothetical protein
MLAVIRSASLCKSSFISFIYKRFGLSGRVCKSTPFFALFSPLWGLHYIPLGAENICKGRGFLLTKEVLSGVPIGVTSYTKKATLFRVAYCS